MNQSPANGQTNPQETQKTGIREAFLAGEPWACLETRALVLRAIRRANRQVEPEDIAQLVLVKLLGANPGQDSEWFGLISVTVRRTLIDQRRHWSRRVKTVPLAGVENLPSEAPSPVDALASREAWEAFWKESERGRITALLVALEEGESELAKAGAVSWNKMAHLLRTSEKGARSKVWREKRRLQGIRKRVLDALFG